MPNGKEKPIRIKKSTLVAPDLEVIRKMRLMYIATGLIEIILPEELKVKPNEGFSETVEHHLRDYIEKGVMPPDEIAPAILNLADDYISGKTLHMRAGDYIIIQRYLRNK